MRIVLRSLAEAHQSEFYGLIRNLGDGDTIRYQHGVLLHLSTDASAVEAVVFASFSEPKGNELVFSTHVKPGEDESTIVGYVEHSGPDETETLYEVSVSATEPLQVAHAVATISAKVCEQDQWLAFLAVE